MKALQRTIILTVEELKRNYILRKDVKEEVEKEFTLKYDEIFDKIVQDIGTQLMANVLYTLDKYYGFKGKRLKEFVANCNDVCKSMENPNIFNNKKRWTADDNVRYIKDKYGIDLDKEMTFERDKNDKQKI